MKDRFGTLLNVGDIVAFTAVGKVWNTNYPALLCVVIGFKPNNKVKKVAIQSLQPWQWRSVEFSKHSSSDKNLIILSEEQLESLSEEIVTERNRDIGSIQRTNLTREDIELQTRNGIATIKEYSRLLKQ